MPWLTATATGRGPLYIVQTVGADGSGLEEDLVRGGKGCSLVWLLLYSQ